MEDNALHPKVFGAMVLSTNIGRVVLHDQTKNRFDGLFLNYALFCAKRRVQVAGRIRKYVWRHLRKTRVVVSV